MFDLILSYFFVHDNKINKNSILRLAEYSWFRHPISYFSQIICHDPYPGPPSLLFSQSLKLTFLFSEHHLYVIQNIYSKYYLHIISKIFTIDWIALNNMKKWLFFTWPYRLVYILKMSVSQWAVCPPLYTTTNGHNIS